MLFTLNVGKSIRVKSEEDVVLSCDRQMIVSKYMLLQYDELDVLYRIISYRVYIIRLILIYRDK